MLLSSFVTLVHKLNHTYQGRKMISKYLFQRKKHIALTHIPPVSLPYGQDLQQPQQKKIRVRNSLRSRTETSNC